MIPRYLLDIPTTDPDDARRRKLLNILLLGIAVLTIVALITIVIFDMRLPDFDAIRLYVGVAVTLAGIAAIFAINRFWSGSVAAWLFLLLLIGVFATADAPAETIRGRTTIAFVIPIIMSSVLLPPYTAFISAGAVNLLFIAIGRATHDLPNPLSMIMFVAVALIAWLASSNLERALRDLRTLNRELDQRVAQRTRDLAQRTQELAEALAKNQAILDSTADGIIVFDTENRAVVANPAICNLLGRPMHRITGLTLDALMGNDVDPADRDRIVRMLNNRENAHSGIQFRWGKKTFAASLAPVRDNSERVSGTVAVFRDFTREAEIDRMKSSFIGIASHELRTPLNAILGYLEMLRAGVYGPLTLSDQQRSAFERINASVGQLLSLANNLLDRAQLEAGRLNLCIGNFSPTELVASVQGLMDVMARAKGLQLTAHIAEDVPGTLTGDYQRLRQILINLVGNAIKFTDEGHVKINVYMHDTNHWALAVSDTGPGIPPESMDHLFKPFRRVDESAVRAHGGAGLGLSITKELVGLMGGEVLLESKVGHGSTFTVILPINAEVTHDSTDS